MENAKNYNRHIILDLIEMFSGLALVIFLAGLPVWLALLPTPN